MCAIPARHDAIDQFSDRLKDRGWTDAQIVKMADRLKDEPRPEHRVIEIAWQKAGGKVDYGKWPYA